MLALAGKRSAVNSATGFPISLDRPSLGVRGSTRPDLRSSSSVVSAGNSMVWFRSRPWISGEWVASLLMAGREPPQAQLRKEAPRIVGGADRIAAKGDAILSPARVPV